jgi:hypothetical protein
MTFFGSETSAQVQAGIRLHELAAKLAEHGLAMRNLGSIDEQSIAGAISTGSSHCSSVVHVVINMFCMKEPMELVQSMVSLLPTSLE